MPLFRILYTNPETDHAITEVLEWVTCSHWDADRTRRCFEERFPRSACIQVREIEPAPRDRSEAAPAAAH